MEPADVDFRWPQARPVVGPIFAKIGSEFGRTEAAIPSLGRCKWGIGATYKERLIGLSETTMESDPGRARWKLYHGCVTNNRKTSILAFFIGGKWGCARAALRSLKTWI